MEETRFKCWICPDLFESSSERLDHLYSHMHRNPYRCMVCKERFKDPEQMDQHLKVCQPSAAAQPSPSPSPSDGHTHTPLSCHLCAQRFKTEAALKTHRLSTHDRLLERSATHLEAQQPHTASKKHRAKGKEQGPALADLVQEEEVVSGKSKVTCRKCGKSFKNATVLRYHSVYH